MPRRDFPTREEDPHRRINNWDDGYHTSSTPSPHHERGEANDYYNNGRASGRHQHRRSPSPSPYNQHTRGRGRSPSPIPYYHHPTDNNANNTQQRPPLTRSKSTSAKAFAKQGIAQLQHLSPHWQKAAKAAIQAGGVAALAQRKKSGAWVGPKGARVATAAIGAAAADVMANRAKEKVRDHRDKSRDRDYDRRGGRDRSRDRDYDRGRDNRSRDRDYDRRDRGGGRDRNRGGDYDRAPRDKSRKREPIQVVGDMLGGFIMEQMAKRATTARH